ncbi:MAG: PilZ domain-containing protein [Candidatus Omnitrophica bacterium]|nr:PilZ domain-containing protein [Candidatus Omnitrophota bacterium]
MGSKSSIIYNEARNNLRVKENKNVSWRLNEGSGSGQGQVRNISTTGMLLETNSNFIPTDGCRFSFDTSLGHDNFIPQNGKLVWYKKKPFSNSKYQCGIRFVEPGEYVLGKLRARVQKGIKKLANTRRLKGVTNALLILFMAGAAAYLAWQANLVYQNLNKSNERLLGNSQQQAMLTQSYAMRLDATLMQLTSITDELDSTKTQLGSMRNELEMTKVVLTNTEKLWDQSKVDLRRSQTEMATIKSDMADMKAKMGTNQVKGDIQNAVFLLEEKNKQLIEQMAKIRGEIQLIPVDQIQSSQEAKDLLAKYKKEMSKIKDRLSYFQQQARNVREDAVEEMDRVQLSLGNQGYMMREGKMVQVDLQKYKNAGLKPSGESAATTPKIAATEPNKTNDRQVEIDVKFVE